MPARRAISSVEAPWRPRSANSCNAASSTASRRSAAVFRSVVTAMGGKLATTYYLVKSLDEEGHPARDPDRFPLHLRREARERRRRVDVVGEQDAALAQRRPRLRVLEPHAVERVLGVVHERVDRLQA